MARWSALEEVCGLLGLKPLTKKGISFRHVRLAPGERAYVTGQPFRSLFVVHTGFLKSMMVSETGGVEVVSFPMRGDVLGLDGVYARSHPSEVIAQSLCELIEIPFQALVELWQDMPQLELGFFELISRELTRQQHLLLTLRSLSAEAKVARFLWSLSERFAGIGYSGTQFILRMTRQDIGSYLGLTHETVSRVMHALQQEGLISVDQRALTIHRSDVLQVMRRLPVRSRSR